MSGLLIVGGGLASARAIKAFREAGGDGPITLVSRDESPPYHRPPLSKRFMRGEAEADDTLVEPRAFYDEQGVTLRLETTATALDVDARNVRLEDGSTLAFDRLLIATGASPRRLDVPGTELEGVFTLRTLADATRIRRAARDAKSAVVVGAGFIGMEMAASLTQLGVRVTLVHRGEGLFETLRAPAFADHLRGLYEQRGVELVLRDEVSELSGDGRIRSARTKGGHVVDADIAVLGVGVRPNTDWLEGSGLELDDGVVVNERYETGADGVWAVGDVARFYDPVFGRHRRIEHWSNANLQGAQVGEIIAGGEARYDVVSTFFSEVFGLSFKVFGDLEQLDEVLMRGRLDDGSAVCCCLAGGRLVACVLTGQDEETEAELKELIKDRARLHDHDALADTSRSLDEAFSQAAA